MKLFSPRSACLATLLVALSACGAPRDIPLTGQRLDPRAGLASAPAAQAVENQSVAINLGQQVSRSAWTHIGGTYLHDAGHNAFTSGTPALAWTAPIGQGENRRRRLTVNPVAAAGLVFAMDAGTRLSAVSATTGQLAWSADLTPPEENEGDATGGTLAISGDTLFATTGFGELVALDLGTGRERWRQRLDAAGAAGLAVRDGLAYVVGADARVWAIDTANGRVKWQISGPATLASRTGAASPAITDQFALVPFAAGDLYGLFRKGGVQLWQATLAGQRAGAVYANTSDITGDPVVSGGTVYMGNQSGRFAAFDAQSGVRLWSAKEGAYSPAAVVGGSVFIVTDQNQLVRLRASDGARVWGVQMPLFTTDKPRRLKEVFAHFGPVAAGGRLWVASSDGVLRGFSPQSGALISQVSLPAPAASDPIVVGGVMYLLLSNGEIAALR
ncbi:PQQ-like beta-propeller repeat protein [Celeribacter arenosi]|uniref:PQQ-like beta-propeller repeat protein n=1 Tax=Celeribacter arenosi TaxID=792649 RepID=A0ABP7KE36_9RHOB